MKRKIAVLLAVLMIFAVSPLTVFAAQANYAGWSNVSTAPSWANMNRAELAAEVLRRADDTNYALRVL
ncbi:MAG: hypothetical protein FWC67_03480, partial [Defluviitaleaceae bacterium]|nr:hypothetical protein [Defluviitaleaceae bacterium]